MKVSALRKAMVLRQRHRESGMTLLEVLVAGAILTVGLLSLMGLVSVAIGSNSRNRFEGTAVMLDQQVIEQIRYAISKEEQPIPVPFTVRDCRDDAFDIDPEEGGAALTADGNSIDFSEANPPAGHHMNFAVCSDPLDANSGIMTYDVRWNVSAVPNAFDTFYVTVASKPRNDSTNRRMFALPTTMRVVITGVHQ